MSNTKRGRSLADIVTSIDEAEEPARPVAVSRSIATESDPKPDIVALNILITPDDRRRLKQLSLDTGISLQKLGQEAWNRLLEARGLPPLEPVSANVPSGRARRG